MTTSLHAIQEAALQQAEQLLELRNRMVRVANALPARHDFGMVTAARTHQQLTTLADAMAAGMRALTMATGCLEQLAATLAGKGPPPAT